MAESQDTFEQFSCSDCGHPIDEVPTLGPRTPCPRCGSTRRRGTVLVNVKVGISVGSSVRATSETKRPKKPGKPRKPFYEEVERVETVETFKATGERRRVHRILDYVKDRYFERIVDVITGRVVRDVDEPLSAHRSRGFAKAPRADSLDTQE